MLRKVTLFLSILLFTQIAPAYDCADKAFGGMLPKSSQEQEIVLCKKEFAIGFSPTKKSLLWAAYLLDPEKITSPNAVDSLSFKIDPAIPKDQQAALADYVGSGYDRGHMVPFEDVNHDTEAAADSMMLTNVIPQQPTNNRGVWRILEKMVREKSLDGYMFVIVGPIYDATSTSIGPNHIPVPAKLFKIIIDPRTRTSTTYIIPNSSTSIPSGDLPSYVTTREEVKRQTAVEPVPSVVLTDAR